MEEAGTSIIHVNTSNYSIILYQAMKELTGFARPKIAESFISHLQSHMYDKGENWEVSKVHPGNHMIREYYYLNDAFYDLQRDLTSSMDHLTLLVLAREKEAYQM